MHNRADNPYLNSVVDSNFGMDPRFDRRPQLRITLLFLLMVFAVVLIGYRLVYVQTRLSAAYATEFERLVELQETIPCRDGRIIAAGGEVLAEDEQMFGLKIHYRWLEDPPDPRWLDAQAISRLDRKARRDADQVSQSRAEVLRLRDQLWRDLARVMEVQPRLLSARRGEIQRRVEKIYQLVERRREQSLQQGKAPRATPSASTGFWNNLWSTLQSALTTPPEREAVEPLVIREQQDYHLLFSNLPIEVAVAIEGHPEMFPGARIAVENRRVYPHGETAPHIVGYRTHIDEETLTIRKEQFPEGDPLDYQPGDRIGRSGLEKQYERQLRGLRGVRKLWKNHRGEVVKSEIVREPRPGQDLILSLSIPAQQAAEQLLDERLQHEQLDETNGKPLPIPPGGAIIVLDVRTGKVLAAASAPRFNINDIIHHDADTWQEILDDPQKPLFHRATEMALPPGSVFKALSAIAFLESGRLDPSHNFHCQGYLDDPDRYRCLIYRNFGASHGDITLTDALARSCNVYFFDAARRIGGASISEWGTRFGFGRITGIDLPGERGGNLPIIHPATGNRRQVDRTNGESLQLAIGQSRLTTTPLQVARMMAAIANGGILVTPRLVDSFGTIQIDGDASATPETDGENSHIEGLSSRTLHFVRRGLEAVVADSHGTGYKTVRTPLVAIAGKTGTAEAGGGKPDHAWFAGYAPADRPKVAFVVVLENAGSGGHAAGPVARQLVQALVSQGIITGQALRGASAN
jgi:penicillin-binding protein 2